MDKSAEDAMREVISEVKLFGSNPIGKVLRTPDDRFANLPGFSFKPNFVLSRVIPTVSGEPIRIHYLDEGPRDAKEVFLLMHGEPTWCFLYRKMIPRLVEAGIRCIAPDLVGFGRSDKPAVRSDYTYARLIEWMADFVRQLNLMDVNIFCQDWGGLVGLRLVALMPERFSRVAIGNTGLPTGGKISRAFAIWATQISQQAPEWSTLMATACEGTLTDADSTAYEVPFPSEEFKVASRVLPQLVPASMDHPQVEENSGALRIVFANWTKPFLTAWGAKDRILPSDPLQKNFIDLVPGAKGQPHKSFADGGHFVQEDCGPELAQLLVDFIRNNPRPDAKL